jgi:hypothetical protein
LADVWIALAKAGVMLEGKAGPKQQQCARLKKIRKGKDDGFLSTPLLEGRKKGT